MSHSDPYCKSAAKAATYSRHQNCCYACSLTSPTTHVILLIKQHILLIKQRILLIKTAAKAATYSPHQNCRDAYPFTKGYAFNTCIGTHSILVLGLIQYSFNTRIGTHSRVPLYKGSHLTQPSNTATVDSEETAATHSPHQTTHSPHQTTHSPHQTTYSSYQNCRDAYPFTSPAPHNIQMSFDLNVSCSSC